MTTVEVVWRGLDDESRLDVASVEFDADGGFVATGRQSTERYRAQWDLVVDSSWRTRLFTVDVEGYAPSSAAESATSSKCSTCGGCAKNGPTIARHSANSGPPRKPTVWSSSVSHWMVSR